MAYKEIFSTEDCELCNKLKVMRFSGMAEVLEGLHRNSNSDLVSFRDKVSRLVNAEWNLRYNKKLKRFIKATLKYSETYDEQTLNRLGFPSGAVVSSVATDSPAYAAGIRRGDIITEFASQKISNYNDLYDAISNCTPGEKVSVKLYRSGKYYKTDIKVLSNN